MDSVGKHSVKAELDKAVSALKVGQLLRGYAEDASKTLRRLFSSDTSTSRSPAMNVAAGAPTGLNVVMLKLFGTETCGLLETGAVPNLTSEKLCD